MNGFSATDRNVTMKSATKQTKGPQSSTPIARVAITCPCCGEEFTPDQVEQVRSVLCEGEDPEMTPAQPKSMLDAMNAELDRPDRED